MGVMFFVLITLGCGGETPTVATVAQAEPVASVEPVEPVAPIPPPPEEKMPTLRPPPPGFVALVDVIPNLGLEIRYHTENNFTGAPVPGYAAPGAWLLVEAAEALARVQASLAPEGLGLYVYDAYRPARGTKAFVAWAARTGQIHLVDGGYIARRSGHNQGDTIDLSLCTLSTGQPVDMGTDWDLLDARSHTKNATGEALKNRLRLRDAMSAQGFHPYSKEWWHFSMDLPGLKHRDVPYGAEELDEGAWSPPPGWDQPGWTP
ncbi:MAG: M15 family metallopeptidase [Deltaproteobacteria bacterium]|nr:M15 family metallopeptidase [Deltaproteobacteria bacterium]